MVAGGSGTGATSNFDTVEMVAQDLTPKVEQGSGDGTPTQQNRICFAPSEQGYNHGSDRMRPLRTMPFDSQTWIGNFDDLGSRVWPHPSFKELLARSLTGDPKFPLPDTVAKDSRFQNPRMRCSGNSCCPTTHSPFVEYEKPSRLETLAFERTQNVIVYPFYVRLSKHLGLQKLFAIVHRHKDGEYKFWKAEGTYHDSYGLIKGSISIFPSPKSTQGTTVGSLSASKRKSISTPTKSRDSAAQLIEDLDDTPLRVIQKARTLNRSKDVERLDEDPFRDCPEPPSKRRTLAGSPMPQTRGSNNAKISETATLRVPTTSTIPRVRGLSRTPIKQSSYAGIQKPTRTLLQVNEVCMLAYHLTGQDLKLMYRTNAFTIESDEGSLMDDTTGCAFEINEQHAQYVLSSSQKSLKVIMSKSTTWSITETTEDLTGGIILLEFGGVSARDEFIAHLKDVDGMNVQSIGCADDLVIEPMYSKLLKQLARSRKAMFDAWGENEITSQPSAERTQSLPAENSSEVDGSKAVSCPPALIETASCQVPAFSAASKSAVPLATLSSVELPEPCSSARTSTTTSISEVVASSTASPSTQSQETTEDAARLELEVPTSEELMKKELLSLLREVYIKYPGAQDDDHVEEMALLLKAPLLANDKARVKELRMDLKVLSPSPTPQDEYDSDTSSLTEFDCAEDENLTEAHVSPRVSLRSSQRRQLQEPTNAIVAPPSQTPLLPQELPAPPRARGCVVIDMTDEDEPSPVKQENTQRPEHPMAPIPYKTPTATPASTPSVGPSEDLSFTAQFGPDPLAEEYGRITTQICQEYSMRVFALAEVKDLIQRMKQAVKADDRAALCRAYGALQAFLITVE
ncbi:hypothetical protein KCU65_g5264, partial [Aureobasidium melanogenum]